MDNGYKNHGFLDVFGTDHLNTPNIGKYTAASLDGYLLQCGAPQL